MEDGNVFPIWKVGLSPLSTTLKLHPSQIQEVNQT